MPSNVILKTTNLQKSFSGIIAAENINISVSEGEIIGIIGANGAGKTVFVNMITGYLKPTSGKIEFDNKDITGIEPRNATHIGVCRSFQVSQVFMTMTVKQNLMVAMSLAKKSGYQLLNPIDDDKLSKELIDAGEKVEEKVWRMPLNKNFDKLIDSKNADMQNINYVGGAGSTTAAQFLQRFILNKTPWAHLDIAGMAFSKYGGALNSGGATGYGVRLLNKLIEDKYE